MRDKKKEKLHPNHAIRCSNEDWEYIVKLKPRDKSWGLFLKELVETIKKIKDL